MRNSDVETNLRILKTPHFIYQLTIGSSYLKPMIIWTQLLSACQTAEVNMLY